MARKAAIYLRSSKDRHDVSVDSQRSELTRYAQEKGDVIVAEFVDKVESAKTDDRPAFQAMIAEVKSKECRFTRIYCYDTSRFSRRQYHAQMYKHLLKKQAVELHFLKLPKTDSMLDPVVESLMEIFDEFHSQKSKMDGLRGMRENIKQGWRAGGKAILGYQLDKHVVGTRDGQPITKSKLIADPKTFHLVQGYLKGRARNESRKALIEKLNLNQHYSSLVYLEDSALTYAGHTVWNRHNEFIDGQYVGGKRYKDRSEWVITRDTHEAMITDEEADAILRLKEKQRRKARRLHKNNYLFSTLLRCACGANLDGDGGYYRCHDRCGCRSIKKETLEKGALELLLNEFLTFEHFHHLKNDVEKEYNNKHSKKDNLLDQLESELKDTDRQINEIVNLLPKVKHQRPLLDRLDQLEEERVVLLDNIAQEESTETPTIVKCSDEMLEDFVDKYRKDLQCGETERKKAVLRTLIGDGEFDGESLKLNPSYVSITGVNLASPRGFEPLLPP